MLGLAAALAPMLGSLPLIGAFDGAWSKIFIGRHAQQTSTGSERRHGRRPGKGGIQEGPPHE